MSYVEIYNEEIRDLLSNDNKKLEIKGNHGAVAGKHTVELGYNELGYNEHPVITNTLHFSVSSW